MVDFESKLVDPLRIHILKETQQTQGQSIIYNMFAEQRSFDNYALLYTAELAKHYNLPASVHHVIQRQIKNRTFARQYYFSLVGLKESAPEIRKQGFMFFETDGDIVSDVVKMVKDTNAAVLVFDYIPIPSIIQWQLKIAKKVQCSVYAIECQTLPIRLATKEPYLPVNIRKLAYDSYPKYLKKFPKVPKFPKWNLKCRQDSFDYEEAIRKIINNKQMMRIPPIAEFVPGRTAGLAQMRDFFTNKERFPKYHLSSDYSAYDRQSHLNCWLKFGQISEQCVLFELQKHKKYKAAYSSYFEEIYRRWFNYVQCYYNPKYDKFEGLWNWSQVQLNNHRKDQREHIYTMQQLVNSKTHDQFWNQMALWLKELSMLSGVLRMSWSRGILLWTKDPETALKYTYTINSQYTLDALSPGEINSAWSLGLGDKPFFRDNKVFGRIRPMSIDQTMKKGDHEKFTQILQQKLEKQHKWLEELKQKYKK